MLLNVKLQLKTLSSVSSHPKYHTIMVPLQSLLPMDTIELTVGSSPLAIKPTKVLCPHTKKQTNEIRGALLKYPITHTCTMTTHQQFTEFQALSDAS